MSFRAALAAARTALAEAGVANAGLDARLLLMAAARLDAAALIARGDEPFPELVRADFEAHLKRRRGGEPVARILGEKEFWGLPFRLGPATLVPRPDTETLVAAVLAQAVRFPPDLTICDLGTGSGAIVIALLKDLPKARAVATDLSAEALEIARLNAERLGVAERISFSRVDFADSPDGPFNVVVSNPPYIRSGSIRGLQVEVRDHEPHVALDGGEDGLHAYRAILGRAPSLLAAGSYLALEVGHDQSEAVAGLCRAAGLEDVTVGRDLAGFARVVAAVKRQSEA